MPTRKAIKYRAFSPTWPASMLIYWHKRKHLREKRVCGEHFNIRDCYMKPCLSSLVLSSSFTDLMVRKRKKLIEFAEKLCCSGSLLPWGLRIVDIKPSEIFGTIWCALVFSTSSTPRGFSWYTNMAAVLLFWNTNMAAVTSCENAMVQPCGRWD